MSGEVAYRLGDGAPVTAESARAIWAAVAREVLEQTPSTAPIGHGELARQVQQRSGIYTRTPASEWLPAVLADLDDADLAARSRPDVPRVAVRARTSAPRRPRAEPATPKRQPKPPAICPSCYMQLPATGRCDTCA